MRISLKNYHRREEMNKRLAQETEYKNRGGLPGLTPGERGSFDAMGNVYVKPLYWTPSLGFPYPGSVVVAVLVILAGIVALYKYLN